MTPEQVRLLHDLEKALDLWMTTYADDMCEPIDVLHARDYLFNNGGTLSYIAKLRDRIHAEVTKETV